MLALDVARIEAGLLLIEVDYIGSKKALIASQKYSPFELGFDWMVHLEKEDFVGRSALEQEKRKGRGAVWLDWNWTGPRSKNCTAAWDCRRNRPQRLPASMSPSIKERDRSGKQLPPPGRHC